MSIICPTILADNPHAFREQVERVETFSKRVQIDLMDGQFAPSKSLGLESVWLPKGITVDIHLMFQNPEDHIDTLLKLRPSMVIVHVESNVDLPKFAAQMRGHGIRCGAAILPSTGIQEIGYILPHIHHLLIFGGKLGYFGGNADLKQLEKAKEAKGLHKWLEVGWDGGVNSANVKEISEAGIDVINAGGFIQKADDPKSAYDELVSIIG